MIEPLSINRKDAMPGKQPKSEEKNNPQGQPLGPDGEVVTPQDEAIEADVE